MLDRRILAISDSIWETRTDTGEFSSYELVGVVPSTSKDMSSRSDMVEEGEGEKDLWFIVKVRFVLIREPV